MTHSKYVTTGEDWDAEIESNPYTNPTDGNMSREKLIDEFEVEDMDDSNPDEIIPSNINFKSINSHKAFEEMCDTASQIYFEQAELMEKIIEQNSLLFLGVGNGKLYIALSIIRSLSHQILPPSKENHQSSFLHSCKLKTVIICHSDKQMHLYYTYLRLHLPSCYNIEIVSDNMTNEDLQTLLINANILVLMPQTMNIILTKFIIISDLNLIIFDKMLHYSTDQTYKEIMDKYFKAKLDHSDYQLPRILGLSASFVYEKVDISIEYIRISLSELSRMYDSSILTCNRFLEEWKSRVDPVYLVVPYVEKELGGNNNKFSLRLKEFISYIRELIAFNCTELSKGTAEDNTFKGHTKGLNSTNTRPPLIPPINLKALISIATQIHSVLTEIGIWGCFLACILYSNFLKEYHSHCSENTILFFAILNLSNLLRKYVIQILKTREPNLNDISGKIRVSMNLLINLCHEDYFSCIIFVGDSMVAYILSAYLNKLANDSFDFKRINAHYITSPDFDSFDENQAFLFQQKSSISMFRMQELNLLVSNSTQWNLIEIKGCSAVIMLDHFSGFSHFIQSKESIDYNGGKYFCLSTETEVDNLVSDIKMFSNLEHSLRKMISDDYSFRDDDFNCGYENGRKSNFTTATGFVFTETSAISTLNWYCRYLNSVRDIDMYNCWKPYFKIKRRLVKSKDRSVGIFEYKCDIRMPNSCYVLSSIAIDTQWSHSKLGAEQLTAFNICMKLFELGELDENLTPLFKYIRRTERKIACFQPTFDADVAFYPIKIANCLSASIENCQFGFLQPYFIKGDIQFGLVESMKSFAFLSVTSLHLDDLPRIVLKDWKKHVGAIHKKVEFIPPVQISLSPPELEQFYTFNSVLFQQMLGEVDLLEYDYRHSEKKYLLIPVLLHKIPDEQSYIFKNIDVDVLKNLKSWPSLIQKFQNEETPLFYKDLLVKKNYTSSCEKSNFFRIIDLNPDVNIDSPFPDRSKACSYKDYYKELHQFTLTNPKQAALVLKPFSNKIHNHLKQYENKSDIITKSPDSDVDRKRLEILSFPELLNPIPLLGSLHVQYRLIPSICHRVEYFMVALEFIQNLDFNLPLHTCLNALTLKRCGEEFDIERLEFFGDTCLKFVVINHLFLTYPLESQGVLSNVIAYRVKNSLLVKFAKHRRLDLPIYLSGRELIPCLNWLPPGYRVRDSENPGSTNNSNHINNFADHFQNPSHLLYTQQELYSKSIADAFESVLGAILTATGLPNVFLFLLSFGNISVLRELDPNYIMTLPTFSCDPNQFSDDPFNFFLQGGGWIHKLYSDYEAKYWDTETINEYERQFQDTHSIFAKEKLKIEKEISYEHKYLIVQALTHDSYITNPFTPSFQRLNLLGDAVSEYLVVSFLMTHAPENFHPKDLHTLKVCILTNQNLGRICLNQGFHEQFLFSSPLLQDGIDIFKYYLKTAEEKYVFENELYYVSNSKSIKVGIEDSITDAQKVMSDVFKSLVASVYIITDYNLELVWRSFGKPLRYSAEMFLNLYLKSINTESL